MTQQTISIIGLGYMGLPMASLIASKNQPVIGIDINPETVDAVNQGQCPFEEKGMKSLVQKAHDIGTLKAHTTPQQADIFVIAVPTPFNVADKTPDMAYVEAAAKSLTPILKEGDLIILESTSPVGATENNVKAIIEEDAPHLTGKILYAFCPERAIPGNTIYEMQHNDRMVGGLTEEATTKAICFYETFIQGEILPTTARTAELVKLVENASRDVQIAFANELSHVCDTLNLNVWDVIQLANRHPRVNILTPGTGVGGHCIAVDPWFIINADPQRTPLMQAARKVNDYKPESIIKRIKAQTPEGGSVAVFGLTFKPDVDDLRTSPALYVAQQLAEEGFTILPVEPNLKALPDTLKKAFHPLHTAEDALEKADSLALLVNHSTFKDVKDALLTTEKPTIDPVGLLN